MLELFLSYFLEYQYILFFGVTFFAAFWFPLPATALIIAGGAFCAQGYFDLYWIALSGVGGSILGDLTGYLLSYRYGEKIFRTLWLGQILDSRQFWSFRPFFQKYSRLSVFLSRFLITGIGPTVNILAWLTHMRRREYIPIDIIGEMIYISGYMYLGYTLGTQWESILTVVESFSTLILSIVWLGGIYVFIRYITQRRKAF